MFELHQAGNALGALPSSLNKLCGWKFNALLEPEVTAVFFWEKGWLYRIPVAEPFRCSHMHLMCHTMAKEPLDGQSFSWGQNVYIMR